MLVYYSKIIQFVCNEIAGVSDALASYKEDWEDK